MLVNVSIWRWRLLVADAASVTRFVYRCCIIAQFQLRLRSVATFLRGMDFDVAKLDCWYVDVDLYIQYSLIGCCSCLTILEKCLVMNHIHE